MDNSSKKETIRHDRSPRKRNNLILMIITTVFVIGGIIAIAPIALSRSKEDAYIRIPKNMDYAQLTDTLEKSFGPDFTKKVLFLMKARKVDISRRYGAYQIKKGASPFGVMHRLSSGAQTPVRLTINHFRSLHNLGDGISRKVNFTSDEFVNTALDSTLLKKYGLTPKQALSLFMENTYEVYWTSTPKEVIEKIGEFYQDVWNPENIEKAELLGLTPAEVMTVASIVDEETNRKREKGHIGQLYINRLNKGMKLQADPTVKYALNNFSIKRITNDMLQTESPYNTYRVNGLPPGPIRTTSEATVQAILDAPETDDIYMCAKDDFSGYHNFATTYEKHIENAMKYQNELNRRGIK
ncbi:MAG: endolytic transglycosylase MltG [Muribaculaceae bacterium]|nr:endolytic transglycosylase MltG [Muribaculaceae bacterium]